VTDIIQLLPDSVANQIAAGEVIQRPASVIKELVENSIDAGATRIQVQIKDAGRTLIQVTDNGKGMSPTDARMSFERHATSKIRHATDLFAIKTMGFRGEALASIASVADVELKTKRPEDEVGSFIHIAASEIIKQEASSCNNGTNFIVKNLFFNVPARRKFLKSNTTEVRHIINEIQRVALANPAISFSLHHNGTTVYDLPAANTRKRIVNLFGNNMNQALVSINSETSIIKISGFIGLPKYARKSFGEQFFFVNNRFLKHPFFHKGVMQAYEKILPHDVLPPYFIYFDVEPDTIDINIHPTKTEIKFENEQAIWQLIHAAVRESLGKFSIASSIDFDQSGSIDIPIAPRSTQGIEMPSISFDPNYNPFEEKSHTDSSPTFHIEKRSEPSHWEDLYQVTSKKRSWDGPTVFSIDQAETQASFIEEKSPAIAGDCRKIINLKGKYLLTPVKSGLMVIDQRRAHQRILYEKFLDLFRQHEGVCQQILFPQTIELTTSDAEDMKELMNELNEIGFDIREFGPNTFIISGVPGILNNSDAKEVVLSFFEEYKSTGNSLKEKAIESMAQSLAIASSIGYGHQLNNEEAGHLIDSLFACQTPNYTPSGKLVLEIIPIEEIDKKLK